MGAAKRSAARARLAWTPAPAHAARLQAILAEAASRPAGIDWDVLARWVRARHPSGVRAVVGYGSWYTPGLRKPTSFPDAYVVVDAYDGVYRRAMHAWWNRRLPPNVYYVWDDAPGRRTLRGKYNVISAADLERECGPRLRDVYNAGRMTKIVWIAWARDEPARAEILARLLAAHCTLAPMAAALLPDELSRDAFSLELLALSFRGEARLEGWERVRALLAANHDYYAALHDLLLEAFAGATGLLVRAGADTWRKRPDARWTELQATTRRLLRRSRRRGYLRWPRILLTERNLLDLAVNEAERKAGVRIRVTPRLRRHPLLFGLPEFLRVLRERSSRERIRPRPDRLA